MPKARRAGAVAKASPPMEPEFRPAAPEPEPAPQPAAEIEPGVPVGSLEVGQLVEYDGAVYRIDIKEDAVGLSYMEWDPSGNFRIARWTRNVPAETLVNQVT